MQFSFEETAWATKEKYRKVRKKSFNKKK